MTELRQEQVRDEDAIKVCKPISISTYMSIISYCLHVLQEKSITRA